MAAPYLQDLLSPETAEHKFRRVIRNMRAMQKKTPFDSVAFMGLSGSLIAPVVARSLKLHMLAVRKINDENHSGEPLEKASSLAERAVILDDFIDEGFTVTRIYQVLHSYFPDVKIVGLALHRRRDNNPEMPVKGYEYFIEAGKFNVPRWYV